MKYKNIISGIVLLALTLGYGWMALALPERAQTGALSPGFFPFLIAVFMGLFSSALVVKGLIAPASDEEAAALGLPEGAWRGALGLIWFAVYLAALGLVGFVVASVPFFAGLMWLFGERRALWIITGSAGVTLFLYALFQQGLYLSSLFGEDWRFIIPLPRGRWLDF